MSTATTRPLFELFADKQPGSHILDRHPEPKAAAGKDAARRRFAGSGLTLGERTSNVWEGLVATGTADCPVCSGPMERAGQSGHCLRCGSVLS
jgi:hypothetical protein